MTNQQFHKFVNDWNMYKQMTGLPSSEIGSHLYNACNETVQYSLVHSHSTFSDMDESAMLEDIEKIVTKGANPAVHQMNFGNLMQSESESIKDFLMRTCSLAVDCKLSCPACKTDISNIKIKHQFTRGLHNETLWTDIVAKVTQLKTVDDVVKHAEAFETALCDQSQLHSSAEVMLHMYPGSEVPKSVGIQDKTAVRRTSEQSERRRKNLWSPWTITSFWSLSDCMSNCFVRTSVAPQFDYENVSCTLRRKPGGKDK